MRRISMSARLIEPQNFSRRGTYSRTSVCLGCIWAMVRVVGDTLICDHPRAVALGLVSPLYFEVGADAFRIANPLHLRSVR
jgi:hypothetical protein